MKKVIILICVLLFFIISITVLNNNHDEKHLIDSKDGLNVRKESTIDFELQPEVSDFSNFELEKYCVDFPKVNTVILHIKESSESIEIDSNDSRIVGMINYIMYSKKIGKYTYCLNPRSDLWVKNLLDKSDKYLEILGDGQGQYPWVKKVYVADTVVVFSNNAGYNETFEPYCTYDNRQYVIPILKACEF